VRAPASRQGSQRPGEDYMVSPVCGLLTARSALFDQELLGGFTVLTNT
jgi:hypothetical protein